MNLVESFVIVLEISGPCEHVDCTTGVELVARFLSNSWTRV